MRFFYRPSGRELQPRPASIVEIAIAFSLILSAGIAAHAYAHRLRTTNRHIIVLLVAGALWTALLLWLLIRAFLVREGRISPLGTIDDTTRR